MTQAVNLANFANNLDSSGGLNPSGLNAAVPISKGGTAGATAAEARTNLGLVIGTNVPSPTGGGASGTWGINITGSAGSASTATSPASGGSFITSSNIGSQSVNYATTAGNGGVTTFNGSSGAISYSPSTSQVLSATAGAAAQGVGSYMFCMVVAGAKPSNSNTAGTGLRPVGLAIDGTAGGVVYSEGYDGTMSGTWKCMGVFKAGYYNSGVTLFLRVA